MSRTGLTICAFAVAICTGHTAVAQAKPTPLSETVRKCNAVIFRGEVSRGQSFSQPLGHGLVFRLRAIKSGWRIEVVPASQASPAPEHDLAEIASPPYASPTPLLLSTDYSFRSQDAAGWSPRAFRFLTDASREPQLSAKLTKMLAHPADESTDVALFSRLSDQAARGELRIINVSYVPGTADVSRFASAVTSHLPYTAQVVEQGPATPLGVLDKVKFEVTLFLDPSVYRAPGLTPARLPCQP